MTTHQKMVAPNEKVTRRHKIATAQVRATRERLAHGHANKPDFHYEALLIFARNELGAVATIPLLAIVIALTLMFWVPAEEVLLWLVILFLTRAILITFCARFAALPRSEVDVQNWTRTLFLAEVLYGLGWAGVAVVGLDQVEGSTHVFIFAALIVVLTIRVAFASTVMSIIYAGTIPVTAALVIRYALLDDPFYWAMALMTVGLHIYFIFLAKGLHATVLAMLAFRAEKGSLVAELEASKSISDEARRRAEAANIAKSRFLAAMSHELRTPLNAILGFSEVMKDEIMGPMHNKLYRDYARHIHGSGEHLLHLINEVLDLSRIEAGRHELREEVLQWRSVVEECHRLLHLRIAKKKLEVIEDFAADLAPVWADERALRQICLNLLANAIKFTPSGGTIWLTVALNDDGQQFLSVRDNGPGIPPEELAAVRLAFGQGSLAHETAEGGTGLGLSIVRGLIALHDGKFELQSEVRRGTEVTVLLPEKRVLAPLKPLSPLGHPGFRGALDVAGTEPVTIADPAVHPLHQARNTAHLASG